MFHHRIIWASVYYQYLINGHMNRLHFYCLIGEIIHKQESDAFYPTLRLLGGATNG